MLPWFSILIVLVRRFPYSSRLDWESKIRINPVPPLSKSPDAPKREFSNFSVVLFPSEVGSTYLMRIESGDVQTSFKIISLCLRIFPKSQGLCSRGYWSFQSNAVGNRIALACYHKRFRGGIVVVCLGAGNTSCRQQGSSNLFHVYCRKSMVFFVYLYNSETSLPLLIFKY